MMRGVHFTPPGANVLSTSDRVLRSVGAALIAATAELNAADPSTTTPHLGDAVATIGDTLIDLAPAVRGLAAPDAMRRVATSIETRTASVIGTALWVGLEEGAAALGADGAGGSDAAADPLAVLARATRGVAEALKQRPTDLADAVAFTLATDAAADAFESAAAAKVSPAEGCSLALLSVLELVDATKDHPNAAAKAVAVALRAAAEALA
jgi:hypothetical protein